MCSKVHTIIAVIGRAQWRWALNGRPAPPAARLDPLAAAPRWLELNDEVVRGVEEAAVLAAGAGGGGAARSAYMLVYGRGDALPEVAFSLQPVPLS